ncbi:rRNA-processing protein EFG1-like, partial [Lotus japonicus]|uniref:rRNA-processing protein EFG1-like n=1 Tax=Lotus japonicus TaxID=34305 RepID=UPI0025874D95
LENPSLARVSHSLVLAPNLTLAPDLNLSAISFSRSRSPDLTLPISFSRSRSPDLALSFSLPISTSLRSRSLVLALPIHGVALSSLFIQATAISGYTSNSASAKKCRKKKVKNIGFTGVFRLIFKPLVNEFPGFAAVCYSLRQKASALLTATRLFSRNWPNVESRKMHIERYSDRKRTMFTRDSLSQVLMFDNFPKELTQGTSKRMASRKFFQWNPEANLEKKLDFFEQKEKRNQGREDEDEDEDEKKDDEDEKKDDEDEDENEESDDDFGGDDYNQGEYRDDDEDDYNEVDEGEDIF